MVGFCEIRLKFDTGVHYRRNHTAGQIGRCTFQPTIGIPPNAALFNRRSKRASRRARGSTVWSVPPASSGRRRGSSRC